MNSSWFQENGANPHTSSAVPHIVLDVFEERVLCNWYLVLSEEEFSPDLNPCVYFMYV
jgi:hypothetical protein